MVPKKGVVFPYHPCVGSSRSFDTIPEKGYVVHQDEFIFGRNEHSSSDELQNKQGGGGRTIIPRTVFDLRKRGWHGKKKGREDIIER